MQQGMVLVFHDTTIADPPPTSQRCPLDESRPAVGTADAMKAARQRRPAGAPALGSGSEIGEL